jgi:hypothetical protein
MYIDSLTGEDVTAATDESLWTTALHEELKVTPMLQKYNFSYGTKIFVIISRERATALCPERGVILHKVI